MGAGVDDGGRGRACGGGGGREALDHEAGGAARRDLRILDPQLSYPSTVLGREQAIVVNLEHIKAIITANEVLLLNYRDPSVSSFVQELQRRLLHRHSRLRGGGDQKEGQTAGSADWANLYDMEEPRSRNASPHSSANRSNSGALPGNLVVDEKGKGGGKSNPINTDGPRILPFEFVALEACLEAACSCLENEATTLEKEAHPALDKLTSKISTLNLERVRQIKSLSVAITGRVQKVRDELEHLLDDDDDMAEMYLTDKLMQQQLSNGSSSHSLDEQGGDGEDERLPAEISLEENDIRDNYEDNFQNSDNHGHILSGTNMLHGDDHGTHTCSTRSGSKHLDVEELEMLLEAYFVQIDGTLNKLSTLREYIDDTEDYINIMLDDKQNHLLQMGVVLTTATLVVSAFVVLVGIFGMNIQVDLFDEEKSSTSEFLWTVGGGATGSLLLYIVSIAWCKHRRLLE